MHPLPKVFRRKRQNALTDVAEFYNSLPSILFTPTLNILGSGQAMSRSYDVIHDVMFDRNRRILGSIAAE